MPDLKTLLSPFKVARETATHMVCTNPAPQVVGNDQYVTRRTHPTGNDDFDLNFRIGTTMYNDGTTGSVSIRSNGDNVRALRSYFACFLTRQEIDQVIDTLISARELAFPPGAKPFDTDYLGRK